jgi:hypothetical protein
MEEPLPNRTREHVLETLSRQHLERVLPAEWVCTPVYTDYGLDVRVEIVAAGKVSGLEFSIQLKATDKLKTSGGDVVHRCKVSTALYFLERLEPVMYLVYDGQAETAYWLWVQPYLEGLDKKRPGWRKRKTVQIRVPLDNRLTPESVSLIEQHVRAWREHAAPAVGWVSPPPPQVAGPAFTAPPDLATFTGRRWGPGEAHVGPDLRSLRISVESDQTELRRGIVRGRVEGLRDHEAHAILIFGRMQGSEVLVARGPLNEQLVKICPSGSWVASGLSIDPGVSDVFVFLFDRRYAIRRGWMTCYREELWARPGDAFYRASQQVGVGVEFPLLAYVKVSVESSEDDRRCEVMDEERVRCLLVDDCEDGDSMTLLGTYWFTYDDSDNGGNSEVYPPPGAFRMSEPGANNSRFCAQMTGGVRRGFEWGFVGIGLDLQKPRGIRDISKYKGIRFYAKGDGKKYQVRIHCVCTPDWDDFRYVFKAPGEWRLFEVPFSGCCQEGWGVRARWTARDAMSVVWQTVGQPHSSVQLALDDIAFYS